MIFTQAAATPAMAALFSVPSVVQALLDAEAGRVRAEAAAGAIPAPAALAIAGVCKAELYDLPALAASAERLASPAAAVLKALADTVALFDADAAAHVRRGDAHALDDAAARRLMGQALDRIEADALALQAAWGDAGPDWAPLQRARRQLALAGEPLRLGDAGRAASLGVAATSLPVDQTAALAAALALLCGVLGRMACGATGAGSKAQPARVQAQAAGAPFDLAALLVAQQCTEVGTDPWPGLAALAGRAHACLQGLQPEG